MSQCARRYCDRFVPTVVHHLRVFGRAVGGPLIITTTTCLVIRSSKVTPDVAKRYEVH